jgi:hypothetical protein
VLAARLDSLLRMGQNKLLSHYERWLEPANTAGSAENPLKVPYDITLKEAGQVAGFMIKYWEPTAGLPGLQRVKVRLPKSTGDDIVSLVHATQEAQTRLLLLVDPVVVNQGERARAVIDELESALEFLLDDGVEERRCSRSEQRSGVRIASSGPMEVAALASRSPRASAAG